MSKRKNTATVLLIIGTLCVISFIALRRSAAAQETSQSKLASLLSERRDVLKARTDALEVLVRDGRSSFDELFDARDDLFGAELELATTRDRKTEILKQKIEYAKQLEAALAGQYAIGRATNEKVLMAKARRIKAEIDLIRETEK